MKREELEVLIGKYLDGTIEPIELELLLADVRMNEESGKLLARHSYHERTIADLLAVVPASPRTTRRFRRTTRRMAPAAGNDAPSRALVAAGGLLAAAVVLIILSSASQEPKGEPQRAAKAPPALEPATGELPPPAPNPRSAPPPPEPGKPAPVDPPLIPNPLRKDPIPAPPEKPSLVPPPASAPRESVVAAAHLDRVEGEVSIGGKPAKAGEPLPVGKRLDVARGLARLRFSDGTLMEAQGGTAIREITEDRGRRVHLDRGIVAAEVVPQPANRPMVFVTPHGECTVLGTTLRIVAATGAEGTRLEVEKGKVRLTRAADKKSVEVASGYFAVAAAGVELAPKPLPKAETLLQFEFEEGARPPGLDIFEGQVVRGPDRRFCVAGAEKRDDKGNYARHVRLQRDAGLVRYSEDLELRYDIWMAKQTSDLRIHMWNRTQNAALYATLPMVKDKQWVPIAIRFSEFRDGEIRFREGDVIGVIELVANVDPRGGEGYFDNVRVVRLRR